MHFKHYENPYSRLAQYVNCAAANPGADAGMYDASEQYKLSTIIIVVIIFHHKNFILSHDIIDNDANQVLVLFETFP